MDDAMMNSVLAQLPAAPDTGESDRDALVGRVLEGDLPYSGEAEKAKGYAERAEDAAKRAEQAADTALGKYTFEVREDGHLWATSEEDVQVEQSE